MRTHTDFLIIGSGIAGLTFAIKAANEFPSKRIIIATKSDVLESNTRYAQGGIACVLSNEQDNFISHYHDTMIAGNYLNDPKVVEMVVKEAPLRINEIIQWGVSFDKDQSGKYDLGLEGGHSEKRILHYKDITGLQIQKTLLNKVTSLKNIEIITHAFAKDLIISNSKCYGAYFIDCKNKKGKTISAPKTFLATGGIGQAYMKTTNPLIATGDGIAMAYRAGAVIENMEFIQFHPTALFNDTDNPSFLISEAVRGEGAILVNEAGCDFMKKFSSLGSLAPRDIVSRGIEIEMKNQGTDHVYLDCSSIRKKKFIDHFPNIYHKCNSLGIDPSKDPVPVAPAAHYLCGGIKTDHWGQTSIQNLFAFGECASTGLHGGNRLASNSLLEALVFAHRAYLKQAENINNNNSYHFNYEGSLITSPLPGKEAKFETEHFKQKIKSLLTKNAGIVRTYESLSHTLKEFLKTEEYLTYIDKPDIETQEIKNLLTVGKLILKASLERKENRGAYYNADLIKNKVL